MLATSGMFGLDDNIPAVETSTLLITSDGLVFTDSDFLVSSMDNVSWDDVCGALVHAKSAQRSQRQVTQLEQREMAAKRKAFPWRF